MNLHQNLSKLDYVQLSKRITLQDNTLSLSTQKSHHKLYSCYAFKKLYPYPYIYITRGPNRAPKVYRVWNLGQLWCFDELPRPGAPPRMPICPSEHHVTTHGDGLPYRWSAICREGKAHTTRTHHPPTTPQYYFIVLAPFDKLNATNLHGAFSVHDELGAPS